MNIRTSLAALTLALASTMAMAATTPAVPATPATKATAATAAAPGKSKALASRAHECKKGSALVKGKCAKTKAHT